MARGELITAAARGIWALLVVVPEGRHPGPLVMLAIYKSGERDPLCPARQLADHHHRPLLPI